jgi:hypothetical protein
MEMQPTYNEELIKPSRELLAMLNAKIKAAEKQMVDNIERWGKDDKEYARQQSREYYARIEPLRRQRDHVVKTIADFIDLHAIPYRAVSPQREGGR